MQGIWISPFRPEPQPHTPRNSRSVDVPSLLTGGANVLKDLLLPHVVLQTDTCPALSLGQIGIGREMKNR